MNENWPKAESVVTKTKVDSVDKNVAFLWTLSPGGIFFQMSQNLFLDEEWPLLLTLTSS